MGKLGKQISTNNGLTAYYVSIVPGQNLMCDQVSSVRNALRRNVNWSKVIRQKNGGVA